MGTRNFDASRITAKMQHRTLYGYYNANDKNSTSLLREQPSMQMNSVVVERQLGACSCANASTAGLFGLMNYNTPGNAFQNPVVFGNKNNS